MRKGKTMKDYKYPDKDDLLTCELIDSEYDGKYWEESEKALFKLVTSELEHYIKPRKEKRLLDVGCGIGRLFELFAPHVGEIVGVEPDSERCEQASYTAGLLSGKAAAGFRDGCKVHMLNGDISGVHDGEKFDVVLSSHVLQHIPHEVCSKLIRDMVRHMGDDALLVLTTTFTEGESDRFYRESREDGKRVCEEIDREGFEAVFSEENVLPVRLFSKKTIEKFAEACGLVIVEYRCYHYANHHSASEDRHANRRGDVGGARDSFIILKKAADFYGNEVSDDETADSDCENVKSLEEEKPLTIDANICYHFSFSIMDDEAGLRADDEPELRAAVCKAFPLAVFDNDPQAENEAFLHDVKTVQDFLHGGGLPFENFRVLLKDYSLKMNNFNVTDSAVVMTIFPQSDTVQVCVFISVKDVAPDALVYLRHLQGNGAKLINADGREISVKEIFTETSEALERCVTDVEETYLLEIKRFGDCEDVDSIIAENICMLYGMMCGDEGWRNVPQELAELRTENRWGSRDFTEFISFGANSVFLNLNHSKTAQSYTANRERFDHSFYGEINPYFLVDSSYAGVTHGVFLSMELVMVIKTICSRILRRQASYYAARSSQISNDIRKTKAYRGQLLTTLNKIESLSISEMGELERVMLKSQQIEPIIDKVKYLLELLESELDLLYQNSTNRLVNILTVAGLILAFLQIVLA